MSCSSTSNSPGELNSSSILKIYSKIALILINLFIKSSIINTIYQEAIFISKEGKFIAHSYIFISKNIYVLKKEIILHCTCPWYKPASCMVLSGLFKGSKVLLMYLFHNLVSFSPGILKIFLISFSIVSVWREENTSLVFDYTNSIRLNKASESPTLFL